MKKLKLTKPMRFFFFFTGSLIFAGIWLSGFQNVHWLLYLPAILFLLGSITGVCPGIIASNKLFGEKEE